MKDFTQVLNNSPVEPPKPSSSQSEDVPITNYKSVLAKLVSPLLLTALTAPLANVACLLQLTDKLLIQPKTAKIVESKPSSKVAAFGSSRLFSCFEFKGYRDALPQLGKEGLRGFYKGSLTGWLLLAGNSKIRSILYGLCLPYLQTSDGFRLNFATILSCTIADFVTLPLLFAQSRLILQNSNPNFRSYRGLLEVFKLTASKSFFRGSSLLLVKNSLFALSWIRLVEKSPVYSFVLSSVLSHIVTYPFLTVIRQAMCYDPQIPMMRNQGGSSVKDTFRHIYSTQGLHGFYRGFSAYATIHLFMGLIMVDMNSRTGYFEMMTGE